MTAAIRETLALRGLPQVFSTARVRLSSAQAADARHYKRHYGGGMFSDRQLRGLKPREKPYRIYEQGSDPGFGVQVLPSGTVQFFQQYAWHRKRRFYTIGVFPLLSLKEARDEARAVRRAVAAGKDPRHRTSGATVEDVFRGYVDHMRRQGKSSADDVLRALTRKSDFGDYLSRPADSLTGSDIRDILRGVLERGKRTMANRLRSYLFSAYRWAIRHDNDPRREGPAFGLTHNPVEDVPVPADEAAGERVLTWDEIKDAWNTERLPLLHRAALRLMIATGQRPGEITGARWDEIDGDLWTITIRKGNVTRQHVVPLTALALEVIEEVRALVPEGDYLFPHMGDPKKGKPFLKTTLPQMMRDRHWGWQPRDIRRTVKTRMGEAGVDKFTRDRIQGHAIADVSGKHYDRYSYLAEKRAGLETWERELRARLGITTEEG